jgi:hypothetical protein
MYRCPTSLFERLCIISNVYHTQKGSKEVLFNPHAPVSHDPAERAVCILKSITIYIGQFVHHEHLPSSVTSESRVHYSWSQPSASG